MEKPMNSELSYVDFVQQFMQIVQLGATPVAVCKCGRCVWMFEGTLQNAYKAVHTCEDCGVVSKKLFGDFTTEL